MGKNDIVPAELLPMEVVSRNSCESGAKIRSEQTESDVTEDEEGSSAPWNFIFAADDPNKHGAARWQWQLNDASRKWELYNPAENARIEEAFQSGAVHVRVKSNKDQDEMREDLEVFFGDMVQYDPVTGIICNLRRHGHDGIFARMKRYILVYLSGLFSGTVRKKKFLTYKKMKKQHKVKKIKKKTKVARSTFCRDIVKSGAFAFVQMSAIILNTICIGLDVDHNGPQATETTQMVFKVVDHVFCAFFTVEIILRFGAMHREQSVRKAARRILNKHRMFIFDSSLVFFMVVETWVLPLWSHLEGKETDEHGLGMVASLRLLRLLRLSRIGRIARLLNFFPEIFMVAKSIIASTRAVLCTFAVILLILYIFAIVFKAQAEGSEAIEKFYPSVLHAMYTLLIYGAFMDNVGDMCDTLLNEDPGLAVLFFCFLFLSNLTMLNMLIGAICDVANDVSTKERQLAAAANLKEDLMEFFECFDIDVHKGISRRELDLLLGNPDVVQMLERHDVDVTILMSLKDAVFQDSIMIDALDVQDVSEGEKYCCHTSSINSCRGPGRAFLPYNEFMSIILRVKGGGSNAATMQDIIDLERNLHTEVFDLKTSLSSMASQLESIQPLSQCGNDLSGSQARNLQAQPAVESKSDASLKLADIMTVFCRLLNGLNLKNHEVTFCMDLLQHLAKSDLGDAVMPINRSALRSLIEECCDSIQDNSKDNNEHNLVETGTSANKKDTSIPKSNHPKNPSRAASSHSLTIGPTGNYLHQGSQGSSSGIIHLNPQFNRSLSSVRHERMTEALRHQHFEDALADA